MRQICAASDGKVEFDHDSIERLIGDIEAGRRLSPNEFALYYELVPALMEGRLEAARALFADEATRPDALFCANDLMAIATIDTIRMEFGLEAGDDCSIAGFDNIPMAAWPSIALTTYSQPMDEMSDEAARIIKDPAYGRTVSKVVKKGALFVRRTA